MIDCPICHVKNEDTAPFCTECGQRLRVASAPSAPPVQSAPPVAPQQFPPQQAPQPMSMPQPHPQQGMPQPAPHPGPRLHSPLLSGDAMPSEPMPQNNAQEVNRLKQIGERARDDVPQAQLPNTPYKNPYDPRNDPRNAPETQQPGQQQPRTKLRSPLLAGDDFDESEELPPEEPQRASNQHLRSPLLGGADSHGGGGAHLRSPLLGGGGGRAPAYEAPEEDEQRASSGGHLRSPLLGGGGGGGNASYSGHERRQAASDAPYPGQDRRRSGLRSPILGGGDDEEYYYDEYPQQEDEPEDYAENPNVLRSPLLAAKRPLSDRPSKAPTSSNTQTPAKPAQAPDNMQFANRPSPSASYTSLRSLSSSGAGPAAGGMPPAPAPMAPTPPVGGPAMAQPQPGFGQPGAPGFAPQGQTQPPTAVPGQSFPSPGPAPGFSAPQPGPSGAPQTSPFAPGAAQPFAVQNTGAMPAQDQSGGYQFGLDQAPSMVPPAFQKMQSGPATSGPIPQPSPVAPAEPISPAIVPPSSTVPSTSPFGSSAQIGDTADSTSAQFPESKLSPKSSEYSPASASSSAVSDSTSYKPRSRMLGSADEDQFSSGVNQRSVPSAPPSPLPKIIGAVAVVMLLSKFWVFATLMGTQWKEVTFLLVDQLIGVALIICVIILSFTQKS